MASPAASFAITPPPGQVPSAKRRPAPDRAHGSAHAVSPLLKFLPSTGGSPAMDATPTALDPQGLRRAGRAAGGMARS